MVLETAPAYNFDMAKKIKLPYEKTYKQAISGSMNSGNLVFLRAIQAWLKSYAKYYKGRTEEKSLQALSQMNLSSYPRGSHPLDRDQLSEHYQDAVHSRDGLAVTILALFRTQMAIILPDDRVQGLGEAFTQCEHCIPNTFEMKMTKTIGVICECDLCGCQKTLDGTLIEKSLKTTTPKLADLKNLSVGVFLP